MTKRTVETLVAKANELAQKGSWVRSGLTKWLEMWKEATATDLKDERLKRVEVWDRMVEGSYVQTYYLERNYDRVYWLWDEAFERGQWKDESAVIIEDGDMTILRGVIARLSIAVEKYIGELDKAGEDYENLLKLLPPQEQAPIKLTADFWALPRLGAEGAGWVADIIDVQSEVMSTTETLDTRCAVIVEARRMAEQLEDAKATQ